MMAGKSSERCVLGVTGDSDYGEIGSCVTDSIYVRDYCYLCDEPIRVPSTMIGFLNACSRCRPCYRGSPGVVEAERLFWIEMLLELVSEQES